jgi:hypothetical protein
MQSETNSEDEEEQYGRTVAKYAKAVKRIVLGQHDCEADTAL